MIALIRQAIERGIGFFDAAWVKNIRRNPAVTVRIGEPRIGATARVLDCEVDRELWDQVAAIADRKYGWGDGLLVEITPIVPPTADPVITVNPSDGPCAARAKTTGSPTLSATW